jgi:DNA-binding response OmpR family regulator
VRLLIVEDELDLANAVARGLRREGHAVDMAENANEAELKITSAGYDLLLLDWNLPDGAGVEICRRLSNGTLEPFEERPRVLMLTARDDVDDRVSGLDAGADDYLVKPFALPELEARLTALVRRGPGLAVRARLSVQDLSFDLDRLRVERDGRRIDLGPIPMRILELLMRRSPGVVRREELERAVWGDDPPDSDALRAHMHALRSAVDRENPVPLVHTIRGIGYQLAGPDDR